MNLRETELEGVDWINLTQDRNQWSALVDMVMKCVSYIKVWKLVNQLSSY
jgi:hypothetical protein